MKYTWAKMRQIPLSKGLFATVDDEDFEAFSSKKWYLTSHGYVKSHREYMHRVVMNPKDGEQVDHINMDKLDNRRVNLRLCTARENSLYRPKNKNNTSGYKGVHQRKDTKRWQSYIMVNRKRIHLGYFDTKEMAARVYNGAAIKYFGDYAYLNEVSNG